MGEIDYQNQLDQNEAKATDHSKYHPDVTKRASRDEESADHSSDNDEVFQPPETILQRKLVKRGSLRKVDLYIYLNASSWVWWGFNANHQDTHQGEKQSNDET